MSVGSRSASEILGAAEPAPSDGRINFRIHVGVTGHIGLVPNDALRATVWTQIERIHDELLAPVSSSTPIRLAVVSQLAEGADRLMVWELLTYAASRREVAQLEVVLPMSSNRYIRKQRFEGESLVEFLELLNLASWISAPSDDPEIADEEAYDASARQLVARCDVLLAVWRGDETGGRGGTAETLLHAAWRGKPCVWIRPGGQPHVTDNLEPGASRDFYLAVRELTGLPEDRRPRPPTLPADVLSPLRQAHDGLDDLNRWRSPFDFESRVRRELAANAGSLWMAGPFLRTTMLADQNEKWFKGLAWLVSGLAVAAAVALGVSVSFGWSRPMAGVEAGFLVAAVVVFWFVRRSDFHGRWLACRVLAERLRSAHYLAPTGVDFRRSAGLEGVYIEPRSDEWVMRAFEEVWSGRPKVFSERASTREHASDLKRWLAEEWIGSQMEFHGKRAAHEARWDRRMTGATAAAFFAALFVAVIHADGRWHNLVVFLSVVLPALAASLGVLATIGQHRALSGRYRRMEADLRVMQDAILNAATLEGLAAASGDAARVIAQETGDWFGAMWFLDIEHL